MINKFLHQRGLNGAGFKIKASTLPPSFHSKFEVSSQLFSLLNSLDSPLDPSNISNISNISNNISLLEKLVAENQKNAEAVFLLGGLRPLMRIFTFSSKKPLPPRTKEDLMKIFQEVILGAPDSLDEIAGDEQLVSLLFEEVSIPRSFDRATFLLEHILSAWQGVFPLPVTTSLQRYFHLLAPFQMVYMIGIIVTLIFEPETERYMTQGEGKTGFLVPPAIAMKYSDANQATLLSNPQFLKHLTKSLLLSSNYAAGEGIFLDLHDFICQRDLISKKRKKEICQQVPFFFKLVVKLLFSSSSKSDPVGLAVLFTQTLIIKNPWDHLYLSKDNPSLWYGEEEPQFASFHSEILVCLSILLSGKRKHDVQLSLLDTEIIPILSALFDRLSWNKPRPGPEDHGFELLHGPGCECGNAESTVKTHVLRLLYGLCDIPASGPNRQLYLRALVDHVGKAEKQDEDSVYAYHWFHKPAALVKKMAVALVEQRVDSHYKHHFLSVIDMFSRNASSADRLQILDCGLLDYIAGEIFSEGFQKLGDLQIYFDFLSELVRFDFAVLARLEEIVVKRGPKHFASVALDNLIDSNVFLRSLTLTVFQLLRSQDPRYQQLLKGALSNIVFTSSAEIICGILRQITVDTIDHENVCGLNTIIVQFMLQKDGSMAELISKIEEADLLNPRQEYLKNLLSLLKFWRMHYRGRGRECHSLELSSQISFSDWRLNVSRLISQMQERLDQRRSGVEK